MAKGTFMRRTHSTPGVYFKETTMTYSQKSLGLTTLGVAGETQRGPAFQPISIEDWRQFQTYFGGTSTEKFKGSQYPKYELPYIAKSYLEQSKQLEVVRVLGLSGVNAGPAWVITAKKKEDCSDSSSSCGDSSANGYMIVGIIRSRGEHKKAKVITAFDGECENDKYEFDGIDYYAKSVNLIKSNSLSFNSGCISSFSTNEEGFDVDATNMGKFTISVINNFGETKNYAVSLNPTDRNYIYNVIGGDPENGDAEVYVEELYDVALRQKIESGEVDMINSALVEYPVVYIIPKYEDVDDILTIQEGILTKKQLGKRYLFSCVESVYESDCGLNPITVHYQKKNSNEWISGEGIPGMIYKVMQIVDKKTGKKKFIYGSYVEEIKINEDGKIIPLNENEAIDVCDTLFTPNNGTEYLTPYKCEEDIDMKNVFSNCVKVKTDDLFYVLERDCKEGKDFGSSDECPYGDIVPITLDFNNYKESYRYSSTPWIISEIKGSATDIELAKLFRFHTISDGNGSSWEVKVSIENIDPEHGCFDVIVRDFNDSDYNPSVLERYQKCTLVPGDPNYIALKIGSFDDTYEPVSKYVTVEVNENDVTKVSIPAGFMGYPVRCFNGFGLKTCCNRYFEEAYNPKHGYKSHDEIPCESSDEYIAVTYSSDDPHFCGFTRYYYKNDLPEEVAINNPYFKYNTTIDADVKARKQYFGVSDIVGIDTDIFKYKGVEAYNGLPEGLTPCFHLDSRIFNGTPTDGKICEGEGDEKICQTVSIDGITGYSWSTVSRNETTGMGIEPRIGDEEMMLNTIYEDKAYRKFTVAFYGGWDGWDYYRTSRSNGDDFKYGRYKGTMNNASGYGEMFSVIKNMEQLGLPTDTKAINSDYYAYLAAVRQFANPKSIAINLLATPGIDYVNNEQLVNDITDMIETERADSLYVVTTPDKPFGASDAESEMFTPEEAVSNLESTDLDTNMLCSYYPWYKYYDADNNQYIYLPITRDVVKSIAYTDNITFPWYANAGWNRGLLSGVRPKKKLKVDDQDKLYDGRLNFINSFAKEGDRIWGDKNFQVYDDQMNRISKRRLRFRIKTLCERVCVGLLFDPNDATMAKTFESALKSVLDSIKDNRGISDYRIEIDDSAEARDRLELPAKIYFKANPTLEYILIESIMTPQGVSFS